MGKKRHQKRKTSATVIERQLTTGLVAASIDFGDQDAEKPQAEAVIFDQRQTPSITRRIKIKCLFSDCNRIIDD